MDELFEETKPKKKTINPKPVINKPSPEIVKPTLKPIPIPIHIPSTNVKKEQEPVKKVKFPVYKAFKY